jgi:small-conductance mechanosensitive channel
MRVSRFTGYVLALLAAVVAAGGAALAAAPAAAPAPAVPLTADQVLDHVKDTVAWYRDLQPVETLQLGPDVVVGRDRLHQQAITAVRLGFDFGRAAAALLAKNAPAPDRGKGANESGQPDNTNSSGFSGQLDQASDQLEQRVAALQSQLSALDGQIAHAKPAQKETLTAQRAELSAALNLVKTVQDTVEDMQRFQESSVLGPGQGQTGLAAQLADLQRTVPEAARTRRSAASSQQGSGAQRSGTQGAGAGDGGSGAAGAGANTGSSAGGSTGGAGAAGGSGSAAPASSGPAAAAAANTFQPESAGVIALIAEWFSLHSTSRELRNAVDKTNALVRKIEKLRSTLSGTIRTLMRSALSAAGSTDPAQLEAQKAALESGATEFRQISTVLVPIGEQALTLETVQNTLLDWREDVQTRNGRVTRYLAIRLGFTIASVVIVLVISEIWRRATFRYLHDSRRRRQFLVLRRVAVGVALTIVIVFGLVSEFGSFATYAGFVTAGLAVALQNVILAVVAYFFLIGRFGVRVGDRITLAGVTGRVVDIGLVRIYLMELSGPELHSTGRIVVLSNAVLFQPQALFKQIPGATYAWHTITLTIMATADIQEAHNRLKAAADTVYQNYRSEIDRQHAAVQSFIDFDTSAPQPEVRVRWGESGLECAVRYPVEPEHAASTDQQMLKALRGALTQDPPLALVEGTSVAVKAAD